MSDFFSAVAEASNNDPQKVKDALEAHGIQPWVSPSASPAMLVEEVGFKGQKPSGDIVDFRWELGPGVWALSSEDNDVGKSTVLTVIRWLLSGRDHVNTATRAMIDSARLVVQIGKEEITVELQGSRGEETGVVRLGDTEQPFTTASFEATMDAIMLERLGLRSVARWQKFSGSEDGRPTERGWTAFIPALFLPSPSSSVVLGDTASESGTLLQVFLGLPWMSTSRQLDVTLKQLAMEGRDEKRRAERHAQSEAQAVERASDRVAAAERQLQARPDFQEVDDELRAATSAVAGASKAQIHAQRIVATCEEELSDIERELVLARRSAQVLEETEVAGAIFSELKAEVCPRCELEIGEDRRQQESDGNVCMVCSRTHAPPAVNAQQALVAANQKVEELSALEKAARSSLTDARKEAAKTNDELRDAEKRARSAAAASEQLVENQRARDELAEARGELAALERIREAAAPDASSNPEEEILAAAKKVADERIKDTDLFLRLNDEILDVAHRFGMSEIESVAINRASNLPVTKKGNIKEPFSRLTASEKLRLRIATVIALLRVTHQGGPGRHPGLLVIDSPAAEEVADLNLDQMLKELVSLAGEIDRLQVLLATTRQPAVQAAIEPAKTIFVPSGEYLW